MRSRLGNATGSNHSSSASRMRSRVAERVATAAQISFCRADPTVTDSTAASSMPAISRSRASISASRTRLPPTLITPSMRPR